MTTSSSGIEWLYYFICVKCLRNDQNASIYVWNAHFQYTEKIWKKKTFILENYALKTQIFLQVHILENHDTGEKTIEGRHDGRHTRFLKRIRKRRKNA